MRVLTLATVASMPQARALARSLQRHHPDWPLTVMLLAADEVVLAEGRDSSLRVLSAARELDLDIETLLARYGQQDLSALLLPRLLRLHGEQHSAPVLHLPATTWVLGSLDPIASALATRSVLLVPRMTADVPNDGLEPSIEHMERAGRIDETTMAVDGSPRAEGFLVWWGAHVDRMFGALDARDAGARPEDRPWLARLLELAPARFSTAVLDDPGCNLSMWNLHRRTLQGALDAALVDGSWPLRFIGLPGFDPTRPHRLSAHASRARVSRSPALHEICERYADELRAAGWRDLDRRQDIGRRFTDGLVFDESLRAMYASALALGEAVEDLFSEAGTRAFLAWLDGPAPHGGAHGVGRYVFHRVARERPDVLRAYPDLDGADGPAFLAWCWAFGREELSIPDRFMPPRPGEPRAAGPSSPAPASAAERVDVVVAPPAPVEGASAGAAPEGGLTVRLTGYLGHTLGLGAAARGYARALGVAGVPVSTVTVPLHHLELPVKLAAEYGLHDFEDLVHGGRHGFEIVAVNADELPDFVARLGEDYFEGPRIGIWGWETNAIPPRWAKAFALVDEVWVYSRFMAENIGAVSPVPVVALPPPVQAPAQAPPPLRLGVAEGFLFLFVFDYLSTIQRKNPVGLIEAFKRAFAPGEGPQLLIKTINGPLRPLDEEQVLWAAYGRPDIHVVDRSLSGGEMSALMAAGDCYVSLHRAEGFGLTMAEAMAIGKPVIATGYSGNVDFMNSHNSYLVNHEMGLVGPECEIYPPEGEWAEPSVEHAAELMRHVHESPEEAVRIGERAREDIARTLSSEATGAAMRKRLEQLDRTRVG
jgi:Glycosyl transferases group 1